MKVRSPLPVPGQFGRAGLAGLGTGLLTVVCGWPYWVRHADAAVLSVIVAAGLGVAAGLLASSADSRRRTGQLLLLGDVFLALAWASIWDTGIWPVVAIFSEGAAFVVAGAAVLEYPIGRLAGRAERYWVYAAIEVLIVQEFLVEFVSTPAWNDQSPGVVWPTVVANRWLFDHLIDVNIGLQVVLAIWYLLLLARRARRLSPTERPALLPVLIATAVTAAAATVTLRADTWTNLEDLMSFYVVQNAVSVLVPLAVLSGALRERWREVEAPYRVVRMTSATTSVAIVRNALAVALRDPTLRLLFWVPAERAYLDRTGSLVQPPEDRQEAGGRWWLEVTTDDAQPLALVELDAALRLRPVMVDAVLRAGSQALLTAQLQAMASAQLEHVLAAQARVQERETAERQRLENDLRAGAQRQLEALSAQLERLAADELPDVARPVIASCHAEVLATISDLETLAQGLHPTVLRTAGLAAALKEVADRLGLAVQLVVDAGRKPPDIEATAYFALCEGLTNVAKHAPDARVRIEITEADGWLHGTVADDGPGGARVIPGGGLAGIGDRIRARHGLAEVKSDAGAGTRLRVSLPCA